MYVSTHSKRWMFILFLNGQRRFCCIFSNTICQYWLKHLADVQKENNAMVRNEQRLDCTNLYIRVRLKIRLEFSTGYSFGQMCEKWTVDFGKFFRHHRTKLNHVFWICGKNTWYYCTTGETILILRRTL